MALTDLTRISTSGIATGSTIDAAILRKDVSFRGNQVGVNSAIFDSSERELNFKDNVKLTFGDATNGDLRLYHQAPDNYILSNSGTTYIRHLPNGGDIKINATNIHLTNHSNNQTLLKTSTNGPVELYHAGNPKFQTTSTGAVVTGILTATSFSGPLSNASGISTFYDLRVTNNLTVEGSTTTLDTDLTAVDRVEVGADSNSVVGVAVTQSGSADIVKLVGSTDAVTIKSNGRIGIGTITPLAGLHISDGTAYGSPQITNRKAQLIISAGSENTADMQFLASSYNHIFFGNSSDANAGGIFYHHTGSYTNSFQIENGGAQTFFRPSGSLDIRSADAQGNSFMQHFMVRDSGNNAQYQIGMYQNNTQHLFINNMKGDVRISHASNDHVSFESNGQVGIGTNLYDPSYKLDVREAHATAYSSTASPTQLAIGNINSSANTNFSGIHMYSDGNGRGVVNLNCLNNSTSSSADFAIQLRHNGTLYERLRITSGGRFGFNTNNPDSNFRIDCAGSLRLGTGSYGSRLQFSRSGLGDELIIGVDGYGNSTANEATIQSSINSPRPLVFATNNKERLRILSNGKVGIGTNNPATELEVHGDSGGTIRLAKGGANRTTVLAGDTLGKIEFRSYDSSLNHNSYNGTYAEIETVVTNDLGGLPSEEVRLDLKIADSDEPGSGKVITPVPALSILQGGKVGIGITNPDSKLYVNGVSTNDVITARAADNNGVSAINILAEGTTGHSRIKFSDTAGTDAQISYSHTDRALTFTTAGTNNKMIITSDGKVSLGTSPHAAPAAALHIDYDTNNMLMLDNSTSSTQKMFFAQNGSTNAQIYATSVQGSLIFESDPNDTHNNSLMNFTIDGSSKLRINDTGLVTMDNGTAQLCMRDSGVVDNAIFYIGGGTRTQTSTTTDFTQICLYDKNSQYNTQTASGSWKSKIKFFAAQMNGGAREGAFIGQDTTYNNFSGSTIKMRSDLIFGTRGDAQTSSSDPATEKLRIRHNGTILISEPSGSIGDGANLEFFYGNNNSTDVISSIIFSNNVGEVSRIQGETRNGNTNGMITFHTDISGSSAERMRVNHDGAFCFGNNSARPAEFTQPNGFSLRWDDKGQFQSSVTDTTCGLINRKGSNGQILGFRKDGTGVGEIGVISDNIYINFGGTVHSDYQLDDYEEGTFQPQLNGMGTVTYDLRAGRYTKIGNVVHFQIRINLGTSSGGNHAHITNLPFTQSQATIQYPQATFFAIEDVDLGGDMFPVAQFQNSEIYLYKVGYQNSSNYSSIDENQLGNSSQWGVYGFYFTS